MTALLRKLASLKVTLAGLVLLLATALVTYRPNGAALLWLYAPFALLAANLLAAILTNRSFRTQTALLAFHVGLLGVVVLAAFGSLTHFSGRVELVEGAQFDARAVELVSSGLLHANRLEAIEFEQGSVEVRYVRGLRRLGTRSHVRWHDEQGRVHAGILGDHHTLKLDGYRLQPTFNKGFALLLEWQGDDGSRQLGTVNFPSFPEFEWKQRNSWTTPTGEALELELLLPDRVPRDEPWLLESKDRQFRLSIAPDSERRLIVRRGEVVAVRGGTINVVELRMWIGYRIDANPILPWLLAAALFTVVCMAAHFARRYRVTAARTAIASPATGNVA